MTCDYAAEESSQARQGNLLSRESLAVANTEGRLWCTAQGNRSVHRRTLDRRLRLAAPLSVTYGDIILIPGIFCLGCPYYAPLTVTRYNFLTGLILNAFGLNIDIHILDLILDALGEADA